MHEELIHGFPFVVPHVSFARVSLWGGYASQTTTQAQWSMVGSAFHALWFEASASSWQEWASSDAQSGNVAGMVRSLDTAVISLGIAASNWEAVVSILDCCTDGLSEPWMPSARREAQIQGEWLREVQQE